MAKISHHFVESPGPISDWGAKNAISINIWQELIQLGAVYLNRKRAINLNELKKGDYLRVHHEPRRFTLPPLPLQIFAETNDYVAINKPPTIPTHATLDNQIENAQFLTERQLGCKLWAIHRLDIGTSGVLVFAKTSDYVKKFAHWMQSRQVQKHYLALTSIGSLPEKGHWVHHMKPSPRCPKLISDANPGNWKKCELIVNEVNRVLVNNQERFCWSIQLLTGRTHQIRAQLAFAGHPILADSLYQKPFKQTAEPFGLLCEKIETPEGTFQFEDSKSWANGFPISK